MFSQLCVILFTGGSVSVHAGIPPPPGTDTHPRADTPGTDTPSGADTLRADTPPKQTPLLEHTSPSAEHAGRYGQRAGGTHPTGMQSCLKINLSNSEMHSSRTTGRVLKYSLNIVEEMYGEKDKSEDVKK